MIPVCSALRFLKLSTRSFAFHEKHGSFIALAGVLFVWFLPATYQHGRHG
jgi:hypothetical protein